MASRLKLQAMLEELLGSPYVYFQPPPSVQMQYPAIRYKLADINSVAADDTDYLMRNAYQLTYIDRNPDSDMVGKIARLPMCTFNQYYPADNLNHYNFTIYY